MSFVDEIQLTEKLLDTLPIKGEEKTDELGEEANAIFQAIQNKLVLCHVGADEYFFFNKEMY